MITNTAAPTGIITFAGMWTATVYGISAESVFIAMIPTLLGAFGRVGFEMAKAADPSNNIKWSSVLYLFGGTLISAPTISVLGLLILRSMPGVHSDIASFFGLLFAGFIGPKSIIWLFNNLSGAITKATGLKLPKLGPQGDAQEPKP